MPPKKAVCCFACLSFLTLSLFGEDRPASGGIVILTENVVDRSSTGASWSKATKGDRVKWQERVRTGELSEAAIELSTGGILRLSELTSLTLIPPEPSAPAEAGKIDFTSGAAYFFSRTEKEADIQTPSASLNIRGTEFVVEADASGVTTISMFDGMVTLANAQGSVDLLTGEQGIAAPGQAPRKTALLDASDRIQFFLYYPAVADPQAFSSLANTRYADSLDLYASGDLLAALEALPSNPASRTEHLFAAVVKLACGRMDDVEAHLAQSGADPLVESIRLQIDAVKKPGGISPLASTSETPSGWLARSYALQTTGNLGGALEAARQSVGKSPEFGFAWARLAELEFGFGRNEAAIEAVEKALSFTPRNAQAITLRGYLKLSRNQVASALADFSLALEIDPGLGNAWLGQGLAQFQQKKGAEALRSITIAAAVEPNRSFLRSYLGKAFAHVGQDDRAVKELELAEKLDPGDPTVPLYQSVLDQRGYAYNRAVANLEESIQLNDNRAVYRSSFLLDKDRSLRETNLASIYENVGMTEASLEAARQSVVSDYLNPSAHLFLSNSVNALRDPRRVSLRYETPWFNELLLANLLSPAGTALLAQNISQQEYTALFPENSYKATNRTRYRSDGEWLSTGTLQQSFEDTSIALDYEIFSTNGSRPNADAERYTGYLQVKHALTPKDSLYLNLKFQDFEGGDLRQLYDESTYDPDYRVEQEQSPVIIAGYQHEWSPNNRTLALGGVLTDEIQIENPDATSISMFINRLNPVPTAPLAFPSDSSQRRETEVYFGEVQQIWSDAEQIFLIGARFDVGHFETVNRFENLSGLFGFLFPDDPFEVEADPDYERYVGYAYYTRELSDGLWATAGLAYDWQEYPVNTATPPASEDHETSSELLPKLGLIWTPTDTLTLRAGYARAQSGATFDESVRLEPTQVAGFTQSFRTLINESEVGGLPAPLFDTLGASILWELPTRTYLGAEVFFRTAEAERGIGVLTVFTDVFMFEGDVTQYDEAFDYEEWGFSVYANQLLGEQWALGARYTFTDVELERSVAEFDAAAITGFSSDQSSELHHAEAYLIWNHPTGWFGKTNAQIFNQKNEGYSGTRPGDTWWQVDASIGKRFYHNRAALEIGVLNLTDEDYAYNPLLTLPDMPRERLLFVELRIDL